jgi:hypothetical protein
VKELSDAAIELLDDMLDEWSDNDRHYPHENTNKEREAHSEVRGVVRDEAKRRGFWWAR